ncbi:polyprenyl synthetase family protein [Deinococcus ruber]|uniref:Geranylgeranyl diphosphate synthetase n=1 Tax=Deinococcus ruber TaxID=1848197 RepID=A0A918FG62_9DEIO|nr:polyprenyl synthetase family protein [Deinococcus ruber]GGR35755.1 geranylgeranyl diphosphate synthetase [Deinococcus ruber]
MRPDLAALVRHLLPAPDPAQRPELQLLYRMLLDYPERGGKGIRSELLLLSAQAYGVQPGSAAWNRALWLAVTLELFQNWVLIHDDIADDSEERRGQPALHRTYGVPLALNAGDALHAYMWEALLNADLPAAYPEILNMIHRTAEGQHLDLAWMEHREWNLTPADYLEMVQLKTAYYTVVVPLRLGALAGGYAPPSEFGAAGTALGAAFQIRDDVLNLIGDAQLYGKEIGGDLLEGKRTLILLRWLEDAPADQRAIFLAQMNLPRSEKNTAAMTDLLGWLKESGAVAYAQQVADEHAGRGLALLTRALEGAPEQQAGAQILALVSGLARREA